MTDFKKMAEELRKAKNGRYTYFKEFTFENAHAIATALEEASELETSLNEVCANMAEYINEVDPMRKIGERKDGTPVYGTDRSVDLARMYLALKRDREPVRLTEEVRTVRRERDDALERVKVLEGENDTLRATASLKPKMFDLVKRTEWVRLAREARGYIHTCVQIGHGTDEEGRWHAIKALEEMEALLRETIPPRQALQEGEQ